MKKRRKRTNADLPAKGRMRDLADQLWSRAVRDAWNNSCAVCGYGKVEAHHLIPRQHEATRYELANGIALCSRHHQFDAEISPHQNAAGWLRWLESHHPNLHGWYTADPRPLFHGQKTPAYYVEVIQKLREEVDDSEKILGKKFSEYLDGIDTRKPI